MTCEAQRRPGRRQKKELPHFIPPFIVIQENEFRSECAAKSAEAISREHETAADSSAGKGGTRDRRVPPRRPALGHRRDAALVADSQPDSRDHRFRRRAYPAQL